MAGWPSTIVKRNRPFSPSSLPARDDACLLRAILAGDNAFGEQLPVSPEALLGRLIHAALESTTRDGDELVALSRRLVEEEILYASTALDHREIPLIDAIGPARVLERVGALRSKPRESGRRTRGTGVRVKTEFPVQSEKLEMRGRIDLIEFSADGNCRVTDFKTGRALDQEGEPRPEYVLQSRAYGCMVLDSGLAKRVRLRMVAADGTWESDLGHEDRQQVTSLAMRISAAAPVDTAIEASQVATAGSDCQFCPYRPGCGRYVTDAPERWITPPPDAKLPMDTWGIIVGLPASQGTSDPVRLVDPAGRSVCVFGVPPSLVAELEVGAFAAFFGLKSRERTRGHPLNFTILEQRLEKCAHAALVLARDRLEGFAQAPGGVSSWT